MYTYSHINICTYHYNENLSTYQPTNKDNLTNQNIPGLYIIIFIKSHMKINMTHEHVKYLIQCNESFN